MVENDVRAFDGFIERDGRPTSEPSRWPEDVRQRWLATRQGVDYVHSQMQGDYADAWILPDADLCVDVSDGGTTGWRFYKLDHVVTTTLIFVAGPNASRQIFLSATLVGCVNRPAGPGSRQVSDSDLTST